LEEGRHTTQYFEIKGNRAIYHDGRIASARHGAPWMLIGKKGDFENDKWELYDLASDFSQAIDVSDQHPGKLAELQALFEAEATNTMSSRSTIVLPSAARSPTGRPSRRDARPSRCTLARCACPRAAPRTSR
jgi:arylsulfatase A-like enzyme